MVIDERNAAFSLEGRGFILEKHWDRQILHEWGEITDGEFMRDCDKERESSLPIRTKRTTTTSKSIHGEVVSVTFQ